MTDINQCDGCRVKAPLSERGNHIMPDGGYMACTKDRYAATDLPEIKSELRWCIENGTYGPRTGAALRWALETMEQLTGESQRNLFAELTEGMDELKRMREVKA